MKQPSKPKRRAGRPSNEKITQISKRLGVTRQWAGKLAKEAEHGSGDENDILRLRCKRLEQQIEHAELELSKLRAGESEVLPVKHVRMAAELMLLFSSHFARSAAATFAASVAGKPVEEIQDILLRWADLAHYAGIGAAMSNAAPEIAVIFEEVLERGDWRHAPGPSLREATAGTAVHVARAIMAKAGDEQPAETPIEKRRAEKRAIQQAADAGIERCLDYVQGCLEQNNAQFANMRWLTKQKVDLHFSPLLTLCS